MGQIVTDKPVAVRCNLQAIQAGGSKATVVLTDGEVWLVDTTNSNKGEDGYGKYDGYIVGNGITLASNLIVKKIDDILDEDELKDFVNVKYKTESGVLVVDGEVGDLWIHGNLLKKCTTASTAASPAVYVTIAANENKIYAYNAVLYRYLTLTDSFVQIGEQGPQGEKGDTGDTGPQGPQGIQGNTGISVGDNWEAFSVLEALDGKTVAEKEAMLPDGNAVDELSNYKETIILPFVNYNYVMNGSDLYIQSDSYKGFFMPVSEGETYELIAGENAGLFAVVKDNILSANRSIPYATGYGERIVIPLDSKVTVKVPSDGHYFFIQSQLSAGDARPTIKKVENALDALNGTLTWNKTIQEKDYLLLCRYITASNQWDASIVGRGSIVIPISASAEKVLINTSQNYATYYAFLTSYDSDSVHYCSCCEIRALVAANSSVELSVPWDAKYLYIFTGDNQSNMPDKIEITYELRNDEVSPHLEEIDNKIGHTNFGNWTYIDLDNDGTAYNNIFVGGASNPGIWLGMTDRVTRIAEIPQGSKYMRVVNGGVLFLLRSTKAPVANQQAETSVGYPDRIVVGAGEDKVFPLLSDCVAVAWVQWSKPSSLAFATSATSLDDEIIAGKTDYIIGNTIDTPSFDTAPIDCISTSDEEATQYDNRGIGNVCVLKVNDSMYYMYYVCAGLTEQYTDQYLHLAMAYSTDGFNWTRGIPSGIEAPIPGTNLLMQSDCIGECVVKVQDADYPYRMIGGKWHTSTTLYKSADGVHWEAVKTWPYYFDNQVSIIVRGNVLKVYMRMRDGQGRQYRYIGICYVDIWGNLLVPPTIFFGKYLYIAGASPLDDRREILFPIYYNASDSTAYNTCYVVDGEKIYPKDVDFSTILPDDGNWREVCPNIVNINNEWYVYFGYTNAKHDDPVTENTVKTYKCAKVTWNRVGSWWYPQ